MAAEELIDVLTDEELACPSCGYDLRGQRQTRCPECGRAYTIQELILVRQQQTVKRSATPVAKAIILLAVVTSVVPFAEFAPQNRQVWHTAMSIVTWLLAYWWVWCTRADWTRPQYAHSLLVLAFPVLFLPNRAGMPGDVAMVNSIVAVATGVFVVCYILWRSWRRFLCTIVLVVAYLVLAMHTIWVVLLLVSLAGIGPGMSIQLFGTNLGADTAGQLLGLCYGLTLMFLSIVAIRKRKGGQVS